MSLRLNELVIDIRQYDVLREQNGAWDSQLLVPDLVSPLYEIYAMKQAVDQGYQLQGYNVSREGSDWTKRR